MAFGFAAALTSTPVLAAPLSLVLEAHHFTPDHIVVPAGSRFKLQVTSHDTTPDEFESPDLRVEKILMPGQTIAVMAGPLGQGQYIFYDDYHPETAHGIVEAK
ncbi:MAG: cupredoxin domain-containing protein [Rhodospirillales bacterium]|nr:cupredoxin domain-containing protein [Rhodospirillales bacterium]MDE2318688.1 cupredoxin domain-containing protein [Rhodospirillales bacterium]